MFSGVEINRTIDEKFRLIIPVEIVKTKSIGKSVYLINKKIKGYYLTRIYYQKPKIATAVEIRLNKTSLGSRLTIIKSIRKKSFSFFYEDRVMLVDKGNYLEILPWPNM
jgi:hypothetical protein